MTQSTFIELLNDLHIAWTQMAAWNRKSNNILKLVNVPHLKIQYIAKM